MEYGGEVTKRPYFYCPRVFGIVQISSNGPKSGVSGARQGVRTRIIQNMNLLARIILIQKLNIKPT